MRTAFTLIELMVSIVIIAILAAITLSIGSAVLGSADVRRTQDMLSLLDAALVEYQAQVGRPLTYGEGDGPGGGFDRPLDNVSRYDICCLVADQTSQTGIGFNEDVSVSPGDFSSWEAAATERAGIRMVDQVLDRLREVESCRDILSRIDPDAWQPINVINPNLDDQFLIDAWGRPVVVVFGGRDWYTGHADPAANDVEGGVTFQCRDADDTVRTVEERAWGPALGRRTYFMSAGPDLRLGWVGFDPMNGEAFTPPADENTYRRTEDNLYSYEVRQW